MHPLASVLVGGRDGAVRLLRATVERDGGERDAGTTDGVCAGVWTVASDERGNRRSFTAEEGNANVARQVAHSVRGVGALPQNTRHSGFESATLAEDIDGRLPGAGVELEPTATLPLADFEIGRCTGRASQIGRA